MAILNKSSDGLVSVLVALVRASVMLGEMPKHKLLGICCPKSLIGDAQEMGTNTLNRWIELGLFQLSDGGKVAVSDEHRKLIRRCEASMSSISDAARKLALSPENNMNFWSDKENKSADFTRAAAWMLAQDVHAFVPTSHGTVEPLCNEQALTSDVILLQNDTRWPGYKSWATFFGFGRSDSGKSVGGFLTDPTPVVEAHLGDVLPKKGDMFIMDFLEGLADAVPVLDGGDYRKEVESKLRTEKWKAPDANCVSTSLSRALLRLQANGTLRFDKRSDSDAQVRLIGRHGQVVQSVTHVQLGDAK